MIIVKEFGLILFFLLLYSLLTIGDFEQISMLQFARGFSLQIIFFGVPIYISYVFAIHLLKSRMVFFLLGWILTFIPVIISMEAALKQNTNYSIGLNSIYINGYITLYGFLYLCLTPFLVSAVFATYFLIKNK